jgi:hypothetical protein
MRTLSEQPGGESIVVYPFLSGAFLIKHDAALALLAPRVNAKSAFPTICLAAIRPAALKWSGEKSNLEYPQHGPSFSADGIGDLKA